MNITIDVVSPDTIDFTLGYHRYRFSPRELRLLGQMIRETEIAVESKCYDYRIRAVIGEEQ